MQAWFAGETAVRRFTLYSDEDTVQDLTGCTVTLQLSDSQGTVLDTTGALAIVVPATGGQVDYTPSAAHMLTENSPLSALFRVVDSFGAIGYFPSEGADEWHVYPASQAVPRYTFADLRRQVLRWLDSEIDYETDSALDRMVKQQLNDAALARASEYMWPFMRATAVLTTVSGQRRYTMPGNLGRLLFIWSPTDRKYLTRVPERHMKDVGLSFDGLARGSNLYGAYELQGYSLQFEQAWPYQEDLVVGYYKNPAKLLNPTDIPNLPYPHSRLLVWDALLDLKAYAKEAEFAEIWVQKQSKAETALYNAHLAGQTLGEVANTIHPPDLS